MLSVHLLSRLIKASPTRSVICHARFIRKFVHDVKRRGYALPAVHLQKQQTYFTNDELFSNNNHDYINQKISQVSELLWYVNLLKIDLQDARVDYVILLEAVEIFSQLNRRVDDSISIFLLSCCGETLPDVQPKERQKLVYKLWDLFKQKRYRFSFNYYHTFLDICAQNCENVNPQKFIEQMTLKPKKDTYMCLLNVVANTSNLNAITFILRKLKTFEDSLSFDVINLLIKFYSKINDMGSAKFTLKNMIDLHIEIPEELLGSLACGYAQQGNIDNVIKILKEHSIQTKQLLQIIKNLSFANKSETIENIFPYIPIKEMLADPFLINFIIEFTYLNRIDDCILILNFLSTKGSTTDILRIFKYFFKTLASGQTSVPIILNISEQFSEKFGFASIALPLLQGALISNRTDLSFMLLEKMRENNVEIRPHYYWPLLIQLFKEKGELGIYKVINHSVNMKVTLDWVTLFDYVIPHISTEDPMETFEKLTGHGLYEYIVVTPLIKFYLEHGQIQNALTLCQKMYKITDFDEILFSLIQAYKINRTVIDMIMGILLLPDKSKDYPGKFLVYAVNQRLFDNNIEEFKELLNIYKANNIFIEKFSANAIKNDMLGASMEKMNILLENANIIDDENKLLVSSSKQISDMVDPKYMHKEQLEFHLIQLKSKGLDYRRALRSLFLRYAKSNERDKQNEIEAEIKNSEIKFTPGLAPLIIKAYIRNGKANEAYNLILDLKKNYPRWSLDNSKMLITATALLRENEPEKAVKLIKEIKGGTFSVQWQCWNLLNTASQLKNPLLVDVIFDYLVTKGICSIDNMILGPLIRVHLLRNDLTSAVETFKTAAKKYNKTPLRQEFIGVLVEAIKNQSTKESRIDLCAMLDEVLEIVTKIHNRDKTDTDLMIAYARCNMSNQLKLVLQTLQGKHIRFKKAVGGIEEKTKQKILLSILDAARDIDGINRSSICDLLFASYSKTANIHDALELQNKIQVEGIPFSRHTQQKYLKRFEIIQKINIEDRQK